MLHQGPSKREWFHSWEFRTWYIGWLFYPLRVRKMIEPCCVICRECDSHTWATSDDSDFAEEFRDSLLPFVLFFC